MKLIDADARVTVQSFDAMNEEYNQDEMTVEQALDFATDEGCQPTISAIPVEWLKEQIAEAPDSLWDSLIKSVMNQWKKEQEAQDG